MSFRSKLVHTATQEWNFFGGSTRHLDDVWNVVGEESNSPFTERIGEYWASVQQLGWDGLTPQPWSAAFISWCFKRVNEQVGPKVMFKGHIKHSVYVDRIRRQAQMDGKLVLTSVDGAPIAAGDLVWNARGEGDGPKSFTDAVKRLKVKDFFLSHVDIVVKVEGDVCYTIGGNVSDKEDGGSVTKSAWRLNASGHLVDPRKTWIGLVKVED